MNEGEDQLRNEFEEEVQRVSKNPIMSPQFRRRRLMMWIFRTTITVLAVIYFWEHKWVRIAFYIYIPLSLFSLASIFFWPYAIKRKIVETERGITKMEQTLNEYQKEE